MRNTFSLVLGSNHFKNHGLSCRIAASEGMPYSAQTIERNKFGYSELKYLPDEGYYTKRLPPLFSVYLRYSFMANMDWGNITGYLEIINLLNYRPGIRRYFDGERFKTDKLAGFVPVAGVTVDF